MVSRLEDLLLRGHSKNGDVRGKILRSLNHDDGKTLRTLRCVSQVFRDLVDHHPSRTFRCLYLTLPLTEHDQLDELHVLGAFCQSLTVTIKKHSPDKVGAKNQTRLSSTSLKDKAKRSSLGMLRKSSLFRFRETPPPTPSPSRDDLHSSLSTILQTEINTQLLLSLLPNFTTLQTLHIRLLNSPTTPWPGQTLLERTLLSLRTTLETTTPPHLQKLTLSPIHFTALLHLNWTGLSAFSLTSPPPLNSTTRPSTWQNLTTLSISLYNPLPTPTLTEAREKMIKRLLYTYLDSFAPTIRSLTWVWLLPPSSPPSTRRKEGDENLWPSPLLLHDGEGGARPLRFERLLVLKLGNVAVGQVRETVVAVKGWAGRLEKLFVRDDGEGAGLVGGRDGGGKEGVGGGRKGGEWVEIHLASPPASPGTGEGGVGGKPWSVADMMRMSSTSSVYSRETNAALLRDRGREGQGKRAPTLMIDGKGNTWL